MNKEIEEMMLTVPQKIVAYDGNPAGQHLYSEQRQEIAEALYNAGYRKESDIKTKLQKLYIVKDLRHQLADTEAENKRLSEKLGSILLSIDTVKEMNAMCNIDEQRKQAVKEFAEWIKDNITDIPFCNQKAYNVFCDMVNEKLKEYKE